MRRKFWPYWLLAGVLHVALAALLIVNLDRGVLPVAEEAPVEAIEATVVDESLVEAEIERLRAEEQARADALAAQRREAERLAEQREQEERRLREVQQQRERAAAQAQAEREQRQREQAAREAEAERQRVAEAERQRQAELARQREAEAAAQREREARDERERQAVAARQRAAAGAEWVAAVRNRIESTWIQPDGWPAGTTCTVMVSLIPGGEVVDVRIVKSSGNPIWDRSVETAIYRASPLPTPSDPSVFQRQLPIDFTPRVD